MVIPPAAIPLEHKPQPVHVTLFQHLVSHHCGLDHGIVTVSALPLSRQTRDVLHFRHTRSPDQALSNGAWHFKAVAELRLLRRVVFGPPV